MSSGFLAATWPAPPGVRAVTVLRCADGVSSPPFGPMNLGDRCGDDPAAVAKNRACLIDLLQLPAPPCWLRQVHGSSIALVRISQTTTAAAAARSNEHWRGVCNTGWEPPQADGAFSSDPKAVLAILSADCLPLAVSSRDGALLGVVHAGWRGLAGGVIENLLAHFERPKRELLAWMGPAIGSPSFEIGPEVREQFLDLDSKAETAFRRGDGDRWFADLYALAEQRLRALGVERIYGGEHDTYADPQRFHSYRRDGNQSGRMATLLWREPATS